MLTKDCVKGLHILGFKFNVKAFSCQQKQMMTMMTTMMMMTMMTMKKSLKIQLKNLKVTKMKTLRRRKNKHFNALCMFLKENKCTKLGLTFNHEFWCYFLRWLISFVHLFIFVTLCNTKGSSYLLLNIFRCLNVVNLFIHVPIRKYWKLDMPIPCPKS